MKGKLIKITILFTLIIAAITIFFYKSQDVNVVEDSKSETIVNLNEIKQLVKQGNTDLTISKIDELETSLRDTNTVYKPDNTMLLVGIIYIIFLIIVITYIYFAILSPFDKLKSFAKEIAAGNFDLPLNYERSNYFGDFTWAFDSMRLEITKARACEKEAINNNKTVIATLSHDIKTPIASIRAYAEGLEANLDSTIEKRQKYLTTIIRKCDEVSKLTNDLFLHSLSDLDKLKVNMEEFELCNFFENAIKEIAVERNDIQFNKPAFSAIVLGDADRLLQIAENLVNNSRKYAKSKIDINIMTDDEFVKINFRDYGPGIPNTDMPFIFDKFYRGKNCSNEEGSGLGLYIVKYLINQMNGDISLTNLPDGLLATIILPVKNMF